MNNSIMGECPRCSTMTPCMRPTCIKCGKWQEWGDQAVTALRKDRIRKFREEEEREEAEWKAARFAPEARAPRLSLMHSLQGSLHTLQLELLTFSLVQPARALSTTAVLALAFAAGAFWMGQSGHTTTAQSQVINQQSDPRVTFSTPQPMPISQETGDKPITGTCNDGTPTRAEHKQGACSNHGGLKKWYPDYE